MLPRGKEIIWAAFRYSAAKFLHTERIPVAPRLRRKSTDAFMNVGLSHLSNARNCVDADILMPLIAGTSEVIIANNEV